MPSSFWQKTAASDLDQVQSSISSLITPHRLSLKNQTQPLHAQMRSAQFGNIALVRLGYGADVRIQPDELNSFYLLQIPQKGHATVRSGTETIDSCPKTATLLNPNTAIDMVWHADNEQLMIKIDRGFLEHQAQVLGWDLSANGLVFPAKLQAHSGVNWQLMLRYLVDCARNADEVVQSDLVVRQLELLVATSLLDIHPPITAKKPRVSTHILPKHLQQAEDYLYQYAHEAITMAHLESLLGLSSRSIYAAFKTHLGLSPMQYLRQIRLDRIRADLLNANPATTSVLEVSLKWGIMHQGRLSADYKQRFGETPRQTLQS